MLRDECGVSKLNNLENVPIPVDVHILRASLATGVIHGSYEGPTEDVFQQIRTAWFEATEYAREELSEELLSIDVDQALWHLSRSGCSRSRDKTTGRCRKSGICEISDYCIPGTVEISKANIRLAT